MYCKCITAMIAALVSVAGCAKDYSLSPPVGSEMVAVIINVPKELMPGALEVIYRSALCKRLRNGSSGQRIEVQGYHGVDVQFTRQGQEQLYSASVPIDGGGACQWRLSNVMLGMQYSSTLPFGEGVTHGAEIGIGVKLDHNRPSVSSGIPIRVEGDFHIVKDYYPWVREGFIGGYKKRVGFVGQGGEYVVYQALQARKIYFEPVLHSGFVVRSVGPKVKKDGNYSAITYPDGSINLDGRSGPSFRKLQDIRLSKESK